MIMGLEYLLFGPVRVTSSLTLGDDPVKRLLLPRDNPT